MFLKKNTILLGYSFLGKSKDWITGNTCKNLGYRHMSTSNGNAVLTELEKSYRILEKNISSLIVKELKKQSKLKPHARTWITDPLLVNKVDLHYIFKVWVPKLVHIRQFLTSLRVATEFIPDLSLELNLESNLNFKPLITELSQALRKKAIKDEEVISYLKHIQKEAEKFQSNSNKIFIKSFCEYPREQIYNKRYNPEYVVRDYVTDHYKWEKIFKDINLNSTFNSIVHKIYAIDLIYKTSGKYTSGVDNIKFWKPITVVKTKVKQYKKLIKLKVKSSEHQQLTQRLYTDIINIIKDQHPAFELQSVAKGKNNLAIQRKGKATTKSEVARSILNSTCIGKEIKSLANREVKLIRKDPIAYIDNYNKLVNEFNICLKFDLLKYSKFNKLKNFKSDCVLRTYIPKANGEIRSLGIPTLKDRYIQKFMLTVMEPYLEPCGDNNSWGFRPGRSTSHAVTNLAQILTYNSNNQNNLYKSKLSSSFELGRAKYRAKKKGVVFTKEYLKTVESVTIPKSRYGNSSIKQTIPVEFMTQKGKKQHHLTKYVLDADIKGCFDNISHNWLLRNVPIPKDYKHLLFKILKTNIVERIPSQYFIFNKVLNHIWINWNSVKLNNLNIVSNKYKKIIKCNDNNTGIPQGGIISPALMNWTLDGLSHIARIGSITDEKGRKLLNKRGIDNRNYSTNLLQPTHLIRFADDFIFTSLTEEGSIRAKKSIEKFLEERGLALNEEKTKLIKWTMGKKLDFLGWTFHLISPNKVNWLTDLPKSISRRLKDRTKLYIYPSVKNTKNFRAKIKNLLCLKNTNLTPQKMIKNLNPIIWGWSNYYLPSPNQYRLRSYLDHYIFYRCKQWIFKKYTRKGYVSAVRRLLMVDQTDPNIKKKSNIWKRSMEVKSSNSNQILKVKVLRDAQMNVPLWQIKPSTELKQLSMFVNPKPYLIRASRLSALKGDTRAILLDRQEFKCAYCKNKLLEFDNLNKWSTECDNIFDNSNTIFSKEIMNKHATINLFGKYTGSFWYHEIHVDHIIPKTLSSNVKSIKILLDDNTNKVAVHKECHKLKTAMDKKLLISKFQNAKRKLRKELKPIISDNNQKVNVDLKAMETIILNNGPINNYLEYVGEIYGNTHLKSSRALINKISGIIKKEI
jgi:retron-type reverse transcriptase